MAGDGAGLTLEGISLVKDIISSNEGGIGYKSDQITYPAGLSYVPEDANPQTPAVFSVGKLGSLFHDDAILFTLRGNFRAYEQTIIDDPNSILTPVMANVYVQLETSSKSSFSSLEVQFTALQTPYGSAEDPRIRFNVAGRFDPAGTGDTLFHGVIEIDAQANVNLIVTDSAIEAGDGEISDNSPGGFGVGIAD